MDQSVKKERTIRRWFGAVDGPLFGLALTNSIIGVLLVFDTTFTKSLKNGAGWFPSEAKMQIIFLILSLGLFAYVSKAVSINRLQKIGQGLFFFTLFLLVLVESPLGHSGGNAQRWVGYGQIRLQPSELFKLATILYVSGVVVSRKPWPKITKRFKNFASYLDTVGPATLKRWWPVILVMVGIVLTTMQPDLGTAAVAYLVTFALFAIGGVRRSSLIFACAGTLVLGAVAIKAEGYRFERLVSHYSRWEPKYKNDIGFQSTTSELGQARGHLLGQIPGNGRIKNILPAAHTDFIFATVGEEFGLVGALVVIVLQFLIPLRLFTVSRKSVTPFGSLVCMGVGIWFAVHTVVNVMMANGALPPIGIPLPLISYGGSSMLSLWLAIGVCNLTLVPLPHKEVSLARLFYRRRNRRAHLPGT